MQVYGDRHLGQYRQTAVHFTEPVHRDQDRDCLAKA
jgi:hypothetical protein